MLKQVVNEMMRNAAEEIGVTHCEENIEQIERDLEHGFGIIVNYDGPITVDFMDVLVGVIQQWQEDTENNM